MRNILIVVVCAVFGGLAIGAAAWDRTHGRKDENWDDPFDLPVWAYGMMAIGAIAMIVSSIADQNWVGVAVSIAFGLVFVARHRFHRG